jgi:hypothetical protein
MFGNKMQREYGDLPPHSWVFAISELRDHQIERGMRKLLNKGGASAPTLPQFVSACKWSDESDQEPTPSNVALPESPYNEPVWRHSQKCMLAYLWLNSVPEAKIAEMIRIKNEIVQDFQQMLREDDNITGKDIKYVLFSAWGKI